MVIRKSPRQDYLKWQRRNQRTVVKSSYILLMLSKSHKAARSRWSLSPSTSAISFYTTRYQLSIEHSPSSAGTQDPAGNVRIPSVHERPQGANNPQRAGITLP